MSELGGFKAWVKVALVIQDGEESLLLVVPNTKGRLIYEEFSPAEGKSSNESKFYELKTARLLPSNSDDESLVFLIKADKQDAEMLSELKED